MKLAKRANPIDRTMDQASEALVRTDYFRTVELCLLGLRRAHAAGDFERMARITLPLQEARRQIRQQACDTGRCVVVRALPSFRSPMEPGCYLVEPPLIAMDAKILRAMADRHRVPRLVLTREPLTKAGLWPIAGVGIGDARPVTLRVYVPPPVELTPEWFQRTQEALGDAGLNKLDPEWPADHRVEDLLEYIDAVPGHEKLIQALGDACREAATRPVSASLRRRPIFEEVW
jgi:hypothetical protein